MTTLRAPWEPIGTLAGRTVGEEHVARPPELTRNPRSAGALRARGATRLTARRSAGRAESAAPERGQGSGILAGLERAERERLRHLGWIHQVRDVGQPSMAYLDRGSGRAQGGDLPLEAVGS